MIQRSPAHSPPPLTIAAVREAVRAVLRDDPSVIAVYLFGSLAKNAAENARDADVAILLTPKPGPQERSDHLLNTKSGLEDRLGRSVDVIHLNTADPVLQREVRKDGILLLERERRARLAWLVHSRKLWIDRQPSHSRYMSRLAERYQGRAPRG